MTRQKFGVQPRMISFAGFCLGIFSFSFCLSTLFHLPERPKGAKDEVKEARRAKRRPEGPQTRSWGPEGP